MEQSKVGQLCYWMVRQKEGRELLTELKQMMMNNIALPRPPELLEGFGGAQNYLVHRDGQVALIKFIELTAKQFQDKENAILRDAENKAKKEKRK